MTSPGFSPDQPARPGTLVDYGMGLLPPPFADTFSISFFFCLFLQCDGLNQWQNYGVLQRFPGTPQAQANPDAVSAVGRDRQIARGANEPVASYGERVRAARTTWRFAGNAQTLLRQVWAYFAPSPPPHIRYVVNGVQDGVRFAEWTTIAADGTIAVQRVSPSNWDWDGQQGQTVTDASGTHSTLVRFWLLIYLQGFPIYWGASPVGSGLDWGVDQSVASWGLGGPNRWYLDVRAIVLQWKAAGSHAGVLASACDAGIINVFGDPDVVFNPDNPPGGSGDAAMPDGTWSDPTNRLPACVYLGGV